MCEKAEIGLVGEKRSKICSCLHFAHMPSLDIAVSIVTVGVPCMVVRRLSEEVPFTCVSWLPSSPCVVERISRESSHLESVFYAPVGTWVQKHKYMCRKSTHLKV